MRLLPAASVLALSLGARAQWIEAEEIAPPWLGDYDTVAIEGDTLVIGARDSYVNYTWRGRAMIYARTPSGFAGTPHLVEPSTWNTNDSFGTSLSLDGDTLAVGQTGYELGTVSDESVGLAWDPNSGTMYGVDVQVTVSSNNSYLLTVDPVTGFGTRVGWDLGFDDVQGLAFDPLTDTLYGVDNDTDQLLVIDPATNSAVAVGPLGFGTVGGLAFDPNAGVMYATDHFTDLLLTVDTASGAATPVGPLSSAFNLGGLAFDPDTDTLYGSNFQFGVYTIDTATGAATALGPATGARALAFDPGIDQLYGSGDDLIAIDTATGAGQVIGPIYSYRDDIGAVYVFERDLGGPGNWGESAALYSPDLAHKDFFGADVALEGDELLIGMAQVDASKTGRALLYRRDQGVWSLATELFPSPITGLDRFGMQVELEGDTAAVGAPYDDVLGAFTGTVFVFERDAGGPDNWGQVARLLPPDVAAGDRFGWTVELTGDTLVAGAPDHDSEGDDAGAAYVFQRDQGGPNAWGQVQKLVSPTPHEQAFFGYSVAAEGGQVLVGSLYDPTGAHRGGSVYVFGASAESSLAFQQQLVPETLAAFDGFGYSVAVDGCDLVGLAFGRDAVFRFERRSVTTYCTAGVSANGCEARLSATGTPSASSPSGFVLRANGVEGQKQGLFFYGTAGRSALPWGNGTSVRCTPAPVFRGGLLAGSGTAAQCDGVFAYDLTERWTAKPAHNPGAGALTQAQFWYRDPQNTSNQPTSLSDAVEFCIEP